MEFHPGAFADYAGPIPDRPNGQDIFWVTVWFDAQEAKLTTPALLRLMTFRIYNRQVTIDPEPKHQQNTHCLSLRIEGHFGDDEAILNAAGQRMDWYVEEFNAGKKFINRRFIFRRRSPADA